MKMRDLSVEVIWMSPAGVGFDGATNTGGEDFVTTKLIFRNYFDLGSYLAEY